MGFGGGGGGRTVVVVRGILMSALMCCRVKPAMMLLGLLSFFSEFELSRGVCGLPGSFLISLG